MISKILEGKKLQYFIVEEKDQEPKKDSNKNRSSNEERKGNALAPGADEGRSDLRKATVSRKQASIRGYPNGETRMVKTIQPMVNKIVIGGEPPELKHLSRARKRNQQRFRK